MDEGNNCDNKENTVLNELRYLLEVCEALDREEIINEIRSIVLDNDL